MSENVMKKGQARFSILGKAHLTEYTYAIDNKSDSGYIYNRLNLGIDCGNGNVVYAEMMGGYNPINPIAIYAHGKKKSDKNDSYIDDFKNQYQIAWEDRFDNSILSNIGENCFIKVSLEKDKDGKNVIEKFLSGYDAIDYIQKNLNDGDVVRVVGNISYSVYNDNVSMRKDIKGIYINSPETDPDTFKATFVQSFLINPDSLDKKVNEEKNCLTVYGYVVDYMSKYGNTPIKQYVAFPKSFDIDLGRYNEDQLKAQVKTFFTGKKGWYSEIAVEGELMEGATTQAGTINDLPKEIQDLVKMGLITEKDAIAKQVITGTRDKRMIWVRPALKSAGKELSPGELPYYYEKEKYKEDEIVLYSDVIGSEEDSNTDDSSNETSSESTKVDLDFLFNN